MGARPLIGIVGYRLDAGRVTRWPWAAIAVPELYTLAVDRAGGRPVVVPPIDDADEPSDFDGLLLIGGGDIDPARYGAEPHAELYGVDAARDDTEISLALAARRDGVPLLAVCRGLQVLNVAAGGTLHQHLPELTGTTSHGTPGGGPETLHEVKVAEGTRLGAIAGAATVTASCHHHQAIDRLGEGLVAVAWSRDGVIEAIEPAASGPDGWTLGVQWHPEETAETDPAQQGLFDALVREAGERPTRRLDR